MLQHQWGCLLRGGPCCKVIHVLLAFPSSHTESCTPWSNPDTVLKDLAMTTYREGYRLELGRLIWWAPTDLNRCLGLSCVYNRARATQLICFCLFTDPLSVSSEDPQSLGICWLFRRQGVMCSFSPRGVWHGGRRHGWLTETGRVFSSWTVFHLHVLLILGVWSGPPTWKCDGEKPALHVVCSAAPLLLHLSHLHIR